MLVLSIIMENTLTAIRRPAKQFALYVKKPCDGIYTVTYRPSSERVNSCRLSAGSFRYYSGREIWKKALPESSSGSASICIIKSEYLY